MKLGPLIEGAEHVSMSWNRKKEQHECHSIASTTSEVPYAALGFLHTCHTIARNV